MELNHIMVSQNNINISSDQVKLIYGGLYLHDINGNDILFNHGIKKDSCITIFSTNVNNEEVNIIKGVADIESSILSEPLQMVLNKTTNDTMI